MKSTTLRLLLLLILAVSAAFSQSRFRSGIFLHHSVGGKIWWGNIGDVTVPQEIAKYNQAHGLTGTNAVKMVELFWPATGENDWDIWHDIFAGRAASDVKPYMDQYPIVMVKSCYPSSQMTSVGSPADTLTPAVKSIANYKWHWRYIVSVMRQRPQNFFVLWTNVPNVAGLTNSTQANLSDAFCRWAKDTLAAGLDPVVGAFPRNVYVFDFFHLMVGPDNMLPLSYATSSTDSHPNPTASGMMAPVLVKQVLDAALAAEGGLSLPSVPTLSWPPSGSFGMALRVDLTWKRTAGASTYGLQVSTDSLFQNKVVNDSTRTDTLVTVGPLQPMTVHYWRVRAKNSAGSGAYSGVWKFTTYLGTLSTPSLKLPAGGATGVAVTPTFLWNRVPGATSYRLEIATDAGFSALVSTDPAITDTVRQLTTALVSNTQYYWRIKAASSTAASAYSEVRSFTAAGAVLPAPPSLMVPQDNAAGVGTTMLLAWRRSDGVTTYHLQLAQDQSFSNLAVNDSSIADTIRWVSRLSPGVHYYWRVRSKNAVGTSAFTGPWSFTTANVPQSPTLSWPPSGCFGISPRVDLIWLRTPGATAYRLQVSPDSLFRTNVVDDSTLSDTLLTVGPLQRLTRFYWHVQAKNGIGWGTYSSSWTFTTIVAVPSPPTLLSPGMNSAIHADSVRLLWKQSLIPADGYRVEWATDSLFSNVHVDSTEADTTISLTNLLANTEYWWKVMAFNVAGPGQFSETWRFSTIMTGIAQSAGIPLTFACDQNYPNPFNPSTRIDYRLPKSSFVNLTIFDLLGRPVAQLVHESQPAGYYQREFRPDGLASGVYFYRLTAGEFSATKRLLFVK